MDPQVVKQQLNDHFNELWQKDEKGNFLPHVCVICDKLLKPQEVKIITTELLQKNEAKLQPNVMNNTPDEVADCYCADIGHEKDDEWITDLLLSPRATYIKNHDKRKKNRYSVCSGCKCSLESSEMPKYAIANNYAFGTPPTCLTDLTDVELAMLTPVKAYGYVFSFTGGINKNMKGNLSYYKVKINSIVRSAMIFDVLNMHENVVVLLYGNMTPKQRLRAKSYNQIRPTKILTAMKWLMQNHKNWKELKIDLEEVRNNLRNPTLVDQSREEK